jgi:hypothetical protein
VQAHIGNMSHHFQNHHRHRQRRTDPEPSRHIAQLGACTAFWRGDEGLEGHAADRTASGLAAPDLRMHRTGVDHARWARGWWRRADYSRLRRFQVLVGISEEFRPAMFAAEISGGTTVLDAIGGCVRIDAHAAHRIADRARTRPRAHRGCGFDRLMVCVMVVARHALIPARRLLRASDESKGPQCARSDSVTRCGRSLTA